VSYGLKKDDVYLEYKCYSAYIYHWRATSLDLSWDVIWIIVWLTSVLRYIFVCLWTWQNC